MAERKRQYSTYTNDELGEEIEDAADEYGMSVAELLREGARRQITTLRSTGEIGDE